MVFGGGPSSGALKGNDVVEDAGEDGKEKELFGPMDKRKVAWRNFGDNVGALDLTCRLRPRGGSLTVRSVHVWLDPDVVHSKKASSDRDFEAKGKGETVGDSADVGRLKSGFEFMRFGRVSGGVGYVLPPASSGGQERVSGSPCFIACFFAKRDNWLEQLLSADYERAKLQKKYRLVRQSPVSTKKLSLEGKAASLEKEKIELVAAVEKEKQENEGLNIQLENTERYTSKQNKVASFMTKALDEVERNLQWVLKEGLFGVVDFVLKSREQVQEDLKAGKMLEEGEDDNVDHAADMDEALDILDSLDYASLFKFDNLSMAKLKQLVRSSRGEGPSY
ncbi:hypothetical protein L1887_07469 [Cichorium endivia]|nr:hypothetical protein L1887_07469 [Cichorium endivia]